MSRHVLFAFSALAAVLSLAAAPVTPEKSAASPSVSSTSSQTAPAAADKSVADKLVVEEPTFECLGVEWWIKGDANRNAQIDFHYRKAGDKDWHEAMPLWRVDATRRRPIPDGLELFAGSIFNLDQGVTYEMKLALHDPDGGEAEKTVSSTTRVEPVLPANGRARYVVPGDGGGSGTKDDPFKGPKSADAAAQPGDVMHLAPGTYKGTWTVTKSGTEAKPIVWLGPSDNSAIIDGDGAKWAVSADGIEHVWFWHLSITNAEFAVATQKSSYMVMRYCHVSNTDNGYTATTNPMKGNVVLDNVFEGWVPWILDGKRTCYPNTIWTYNGKRYDVTDVLAVNVSGEGTVVAYNLMKDWGDAIHGSGNQPKAANDLCHNEIVNCSDDGIECDEGAQNIRCFANRLTNVFQGISTQPVHGGPCYIFRNAIYNVDLEPFKLHNSPHGVLLINNTTVRSTTGEAGPMLVHTSDPIYSTWVGNNLFVGGTNAHALDLSPKLFGVSFDYNGYAGGPFAEFAKVSGANYRTIEDLRKGAGQEEHGVQMPIKGLFASGAMPPANSVDRSEPSANDLRLADKTAAVDAGYAFPGITDGFTGKAPDLGAYELGSELPHYGPRPEKK
jgi:hypothetical protein